MSLESQSDDRISASEATDSPVSTPGNRPFPKGLVIKGHAGVESALNDTAWQKIRRRSREDPIEKDFHLYAEFNGEPCGELSASFRVVKTGDTITDRYVHLGNIDVTPTERQPAIRGLGIASALLEKMKEYAEIFGASRIEVILSTGGITKTPTLPDFYRNRGYELTPLIPGAERGGFKGIKPL